MFTVYDVAFLTNGSCCHIFSEPNVSENFHSLELSWSLSIPVTPVFHLKVMLRGECSCFYLQDHGHQADHLLRAGTLDSGQTTGSSHYSPFLRLVNCSLGSFLWAKMALPPFLFWKRGEGVL